MHVKGKKLTAGEKENIVILYRQGKTQDEIVTITGVSKGRVSKTIKLRGISRPQGGGRVRPLRIVNPPVRHKVDRPPSPKKQTETKDYQPSEQIVRGQSQPDVKSQITSGQKKSRSKSISIPGIIFILLLIIGTCVLVAWIYLTPEISNAKENPEPEPDKQRSPDGYGGTNIDDLGESTGFDLPFEELPENPF